MFQRLFLWLPGNKQRGCYTNSRHSHKGKQHYPSGSWPVAKEAYNDKKRRSHNKVKKDPYQEYPGQWQVTRNKGSMQRHAQQNAKYRQPYKIQANKHMVSYMLNIIRFHLLFVFGI